MEVHFNTKCCRPKCFKMIHGHGTTRSKETGHILLIKTKMNLSIIYMYIFFQLVSNFLFIWKLPSTHTNKEKRKKKAHEPIHPAPITSINIWQIQISPQTRTHICTHICTHMRAQTPVWVTSIHALTLWLADGCSGQPMGSLPTRPGSHDLLTTSDFLRKRFWD